MSVLNERIKEMRLKCELTLLEVAERLGVQEATVQRYESGAIKNIKYEVICELADLYGCDPCYLMGWKEESDMSDSSVHPLMQIYNNLNQTGQDKLLDYAEDLSGNDKYKKCADIESENVG